MFHTKIIYLIIFLFIANCNVRTASNIYGISSLENKSQRISVGKSNKNVGEYILNKEIIKEIYVPGRLINFVVK